MVVKQVELTEEEAKRLEEIAEDKDLSVEALIRDAILERLRHPGELTMAEKRRRALSIIGKYRSGVTDLGRNHDKYLDEAFGE